MSDPNRKSGPTPLIAELAGDLTPVRAITMRDGIVLVLLAFALAVTGVALVAGIWSAAMSGTASPYFYIGNGLLLVLGAASALAVLAMATPRVGNRHDGPKWALGMVAVMPLAALVALAGRDSGHGHVLFDGHGVECMVSALATSLVVGAALVAWLRRAAPVTPRLAGMLTGVAATALGSLAYGLSCQLDGVVHIGIWHIAPVVIGAVAGRYALPPLIRW